MTKSYLLSIREIQGQTGPFQCLGSSKFLALKLLGYIRPHAKLNDFLRSPWAKQHKDLSPGDCFGGSMAKHGTVFNETVLPAAVNEPSAGVKTKPREPGHVTFQTGFATWSGHAGWADAKLSHGTPLIVGVSLGGGTSRDHFIVVFKDHDGQIWAIDPLPRGDDEGVQQLPDTFEFGTPSDISPCQPPFFGYFV